MKVLRLTLFGFLGAFLAIACDLEITNFRTWVIIILASTIWMVGKFEGELEGGNNNENE